MLGVLKSMGNWWGGGGGEAEDAGNAKGAAEFGELEVVGAKVVPPFGDAVRFVDGDEGYGEGFELLAECFGGDAFGCDVEEF